MAFRPAVSPLTWRMPIGKSEEGGTMALSKASKAAFKANATRKAAAAKRSAVARKAAKTRKLNTVYA